MIVLFGTETPMPTPTMTVDPDSVSPGFPGFAAIVIVLIAVVLLIWDMNRRVRRVRYREEVRAELDAEEAASAEQKDAGVPNTDPEPPASGADEQSR